MITKTCEDIPNYRFDNIIGSGSFGTVYKAYDFNNFQYVAIKRSMKLGSLVSREFLILREVSECDQCIRLLDIFYSITEDNMCIQHLNKLQSLALLLLKTWKNLLNPWTFLQM